jgi:hypothetical protein
MRQLPTHALHNSPPFVSKSQPFHFFSIYNPIICAATSISSSSGLIARPSSLQHLPPARGASFSPYSTLQQQLHTISSPHYYGRRTALLFDTTSGLAYNDFENASTSSLDIPPFDDYEGGMTSPIRSASSSIAASSITTSNNNKEQSPSSTKGDKESEEVQGKRIRANVRETGFDSMKYYMKTMGNHELLQKNEEIILAREIQILIKWEEIREGLEGELLRLVFC